MKKDRADGITSGFCLTDWSMDSLKVFASNVRRDQAALLLICSSSSSAFFSSLKMHSYLKLGEGLGRSRQRLAAFAMDIDRRLQEGPSADARNMEAAIASVPLLQVKTASACISVGLLHREDQTH